MLTIKLSTYEFMAVVVAQLWPVTTIAPAVIELIPINVMAEIEHFVTLENQPVAITAISRSI